MTNGEKLQRTFPTIRINVMASYVQVMGVNYEFNNLYPLEWWNAEYIEPNYSENPKGSDNLSSGTRKKLETGTTKNDLGVDAISREKAIAWAEFYIGIYDAKKANESIMGMLRDLPPVAPIRPKGHWIKQNDDYHDWYECSECGYGSEGEMQYSSEYDVRTNYCPNCGSYNGGDSNGNE